MREPHLDGHPVPLGLGFPELALDGVLDRDEEVLGLVVGHAEGVGWERDWLRRVAAESPRREPVLYGPRDDSRPADQDP